MQLKHVPAVDYKYWCALVLASIFGANTGDFFSDVLNLGHLSGLPVLAALFAIAIFAERFDKAVHHAYFWFVIVVIRTSATNLGDASHDFKLGIAWVVSALTLLLLASAVIWRNIYQARKKTHPEQSGSVLVTNAYYWFSMLVAGTLGTVIGDYFSFKLELFPLKAACVLGATLIVVFFACRKGLMRGNINIFYYWLTVVLIRSAGTAAGDYLAHGLTLPVSTPLTGLAFVGLLILWKGTVAPTAAALGRQGSAL